MGNQGRFVYLVRWYFVKFMMPKWNRIKVVGVGGAGSNAVNNMIASQMEVIHLRFQLTIANILLKKRLKFGVSIQTRV